MATSTDNPNEPTGVPALPSKRAKSADDAVAPAAVTDDAAASNDIAIEQVKLDTPETDAAIDDIVAKEADEVLAAQDAGIAAAAAQTAEPQPEKYGHPIFWFIILVLVIVAALTTYVLMNPGLELPFSA